VGREDTASRSQVETAERLNLEAPFVKFDRLLHKFREQPPILGQICTKTVNFTPDLGNIEFGLRE
jgi:hypothetical protein